MDLKFLLAALFALTGVPAPEPVEVSLPDVTVNVGGAEAVWVDIKTSEAHPDADVQVRVDGTAIASIAKVTTDTADCIAKANVLTCARKVSVDQNGASLVRIVITPVGKAGTGKLAITATVNGDLTGTTQSKVTVIHPPKLVMVGRRSHRSR